MSGSLPPTVFEDGRAWPIGGNDEVRWINEGTVTGRSITASIPPVFAAYATLVFPLDLASSRESMRPDEDRFDDALLKVLCAHTDPQTLVARVS